LLELLGSESDGLPKRGDFNSVNTGGQHGLAWVWLAHDFGR
jgi:hypothetical protein